MLASSTVLLHHFHPVLPAARVTDRPVKVVVAGHDYALFRDAKGHAAAVDDRCPHRSAPLSKGTISRDGRLTCAYHGWNFDGQGSGRSPSQKTLRNCNVPALQAVEAHGYVWIANRHVSPAAMPDIGSAPGSFAGSFTFVVHAPLYVVLDAFSEAEHIPFLHARLGWDEASVDAVTFESKNVADHTEARYTAPQRVSLASRLVGIRPGDIFHTAMATRFSPVHNIHEFRWTDPTHVVDRPFRTTSAMFYVPESDRRTRVHVFVSVEAKSARWGWLLPLVKPLMMLVAKDQVKDDQRFLQHLQEVPFEMKGMRLGKFDAPLIHHRKLLKKIYFGESDDVKRTLNVLTPSEKLRIAG